MIHKSDVRKLAVLFSKNIRQEDVDSFLAELRAIEFSFQKIQQLFLSIAEKMASDSGEK